MECVLTAAEAPSVSEAIRAKHRELLRQLRAIEEEALKLQARRGEIQHHLEDCQAAARLFGVALDETEPTPAPALPNGSSNREKLPIRMMVLDELKRAYPNPVRAGPLRQALLDRGINTHEKTVGMTLYRLSLNRLSNRIGLDWYYVPEGQVEHDLKASGHWPARARHKDHPADRDKATGTD
jgi:hypothetical protein